MLGYQGHAGMYWLLCHYFSQNLNLKPEVETLKSRFLIAAKVGEGQVKRWARVGRGVGEGWLRGGLLPPSIYILIKVKSLHRK
jgi:hypothetical protein